MSVVPFKKQEREVAVYQLQRKMDVELYHLLLGQCLKRIRKFAEQYDSDADPKIMAQAVERDLLQDQPGHCLIIAVRELKVIGHLLATADWYYGKRYVFIHQLDIQGAGLTPDEARSAYKILGAWGQSMGAIAPRAGADTEAHVRFYRRFGLTPFRTMLKGDF